VQHIKSSLPGVPKQVRATYDALYFREHIPLLSELEMTDKAIERNQAILLEYLIQSKACASCTGYLSCKKIGDLKGFSQILEPYGSQLTMRVERCKPFWDDILKRRIQKFALASGGLDDDLSFQFSNFPEEQKKRYPKLLGFAQNFANEFEIGQASPGLYMFGPPGVGKTHLMLAVVNRLKERGIPCIVVRSDSIFDRMRQIISENGDLESLLDACSTAPVLAIDEFAQERANEFTLEKLFRIINHRFHAKLPTLFTSNYSPPAIYRKNDGDILDAVGPLRSRIMMMAKLARMDGQDARQRNLESLT